MEKMILSHVWTIRSPKYVVSCPQYEVVLTYKVLYVCMYVRNCGKGIGNNALCLVDLKFQTQI